MSRWIQVDISEKVFKDDFYFYMTLYMLRICEHKTFLQTSALFICPEMKIVDGK